ncbi:toll/interleukin-1 receptor domain-containing protein [Halostella sp. PRR32]|uniref:toll/interleukin-1 receptor domain-containing protein n=1 Tax=Halostella sp. PRR32 TaxID=3098147 RepID=UPI002B1E0EE1|nr:toll/interleukin-1 receptor domain-containing protein [Halostella sp. PRR32]
MGDESVFVSHAPGDSETVERLFRSVRNFPFGVHVAANELGGVVSRESLKSRIDDSDIVVAVMTESAATDPWVNQEVGYAVARGVPVLPVYERHDDLGGYLADVDGVELDDDEMDETVFRLVSNLRGELTPLGSLDTPKWYVRFDCTVEECGDPVTLPITDQQRELWRLHDHGRTIHTDCGECGGRYHFDPATLGFLKREGP